MAFAARIKCGRCVFRNYPWPLSLVKENCKCQIYRLTKQLLLIGASRGLGFALAEEYLKRGWHVVATERSRTTSKLHDLGSAEDRLEIETVDINYPDQVAALRARLASRKFDMLFVNAGVGTRDMLADISTDEFTRIARC